MRLLLIKAKNLDIVRIDLTPFIDVFPTLLHPLVILTWEPLPHASSALGIPSLQAKERWGHVTPTKINMGTSCAVRHIEKNNVQENTAVSHFKRQLY